MATKTKAKTKVRRKTFDCVEMKDRIQANIWAEYQARKAEFPSFYDFIRAQNDESDWVRRMRAKFGWK
jgi:hypothetical protein